MDAFAREGLRTLVMCQRTVTTTEFESWHEVWREIQLSVSDTKEDELDAHGAKIEHDFNLVGASAIEDKL
jgi:phospholipid-transporting ATPase